MFTISLKPRRLAPVACALLLGLAGCRSGHSDPDQAPEPEPPPFVESGYADTTAAFEPFAGQLLGLFVVAATTEDATGAAEGVMLGLGPNAATLTLEFHNESAGAIGTPVVLDADPDLPGAYRASGVAAFGRSGLEAIARVRVEGPDGTEVALQFRSPEAPAAQQKQAIPHDPGRAAEVQAYLRRYRELVEVMNVCNALERFALLVQDVVDTNLHDASAEATPEVNKDLIIDNLADLFVPAGFYKSTIMLLDPTLQENIITDPPLRCADAINLTGFSSPYDKGEGRFRHFSANAAMKRVAPGFLVNLGGRLVGGDWEWKTDSTGDIAADLATNAAGREFHDYLEEIAENGSYADGHSVRDWIRSKFQDAAAGRSDRYVKLDYTLGPHAAGSEVGLCRISRSCKVGQVEAGCSAEHLHAQPEGISIDDIGAYADPAETMCGYGKTALRVYP